MKVPVFCYGSYMDPQVLRRFGASPGTPTRAKVAGWRLSFTPHANLVKDPDGVVEGFVFTLPHAELDRLYGPKGYVTTYKPVPVLIHADAGRAAAITFVEEAKEQAPEGTYLESFLGICARLGLPGEYIESIRAKAQDMVKGTLV